ncbi:class I SAM-dependent methyltransferase [Nocardiopsis composta]|uniref:SAM-dependent methyltransferase n=1 Tax=Nocardiopsis composta TaxID=157465 RepID=A0A7W8QPC8_9ACTN|nr:class I SAM-dependent methyltransferase [Nocardiopsis composta]MBB5433146.1 SAM-dependent methyltransferase [Nocardiopsis composta]
MRAALDGAVPSPNIWNSPQVYELENRAVDPDGVIRAAMDRIRPLSGAHVLDIGCGTGFHLPAFAAEAARVTGVEPHGELAAAARARAAGLGNVSVRTGVAQRLPVPDASVDVAHARWAYFFGRGCEPGLRELSRVMRRGGVAFIIDNDASRSTFGGWFRRFLPRYDPEDVQRFWAAQGFRREPLDMRWRFERREDFEAVVRIEFPARLAEEIIAEHPGLEVDYAVDLHWREY